jgi:hypothetical protein
MNTFIGVKLVDTEPMTRGEYNTYRGWALPADENGDDLGYLVVYGSGYESWCPKDEFDKQNFPIVGEKNIICQDDVDNFIGSTTVNTLNIGGAPKSTLVSVILKNGFVMHETSPCVDPANYDEQVGADICVKRIKDKVWGYLGFMLQCGVSGFKGVK